jgi:hypothetical protein
MTETMKQQVTTKDLALLCFLRIRTTLFRLNKGWGGR